MDEADRMLDMGFSDAIDEVIRFAPRRRARRYCFRSTSPDAIAAISGRVQQQPIRIEIDTVDALPAIEQQFFGNARALCVKFRCYKRCLASISQRPAWCFAIPKRLVRPFVMRLMR